MNVFMWCRRKLAKWLDRDSYRQMPRTAMGERKRKWQTCARYL